MMSFHWLIIFQKILDTYEAAVCALCFGAGHSPNKDSSMKEQ